MKCTDKIDFVIRLTWKLKNCNFLVFGQKLLEQDIEFLGRLDRLLDNKSGDEFSQVTHGTSAISSL
jgi:hypothetical protein